MSLIEEVGIALPASRFGQRASVRSVESGPMSNELVTVVRDAILVDFVTDRGSLMVSCRSVYAPFLDAPLEFVLVHLDSTRAFPQLMQSLPTVASALAEIDARLPQFTRAFSIPRAMFTLWRSRRLWHGYNRARFAQYRL